MLLILSVKVSTKLWGNGLRMSRGSLSLSIRGFEAAQNFSLLTLLTAVGGHRYRISDLSNGRFQLYFLFKTSGTIYLKPLSCLITEMRD